MRYMLCLSIAIMFLQNVIAQPSKAAKSTAGKNADTRLEYDTTYTGWVEWLPGEITNYSLFADKQQNLYALASFPEGKKPVKLVNDKWEPIDKGLIGEASWIFGDPAGNVYTSVGDVIYKLVSGRWEKLLNKYGLTNISFGNDGKLYGQSQVVTKPTHFSLLVYQNGDWKYIGKEQFLSNRVHREVDKAGNIYLAYDITSSRNIYEQVFDIKKWDGANWTTLVSNTGHVRTMFLCREELYWQSVSGNLFTLYQWNRGMQNWKPISIPAKIDQTDYWVSNNNEKLLLRGSSVEDKSTNLVYENRDGKWIQLAKWTDGKPFRGFNYNFILVANSLVTLNDKKLFRFDKTPASVQSVSVVSIEPIPLNDVNRNDPRIAKSYEQVGIYYEKGKKGLRDKTGKKIIHPVFDQISIERTSSTYYEYEQVRFAYRLKNGESVIYCAYPVSDFNVLGGLIAKISSCNSCKGEGKSKDSTIKTFIPGEWVPEKTITTSTPVTIRNSERTWNPNTRQYEDRRTVSQGSNTTTKTTPGYRKEGTYKTEIIKGKICGVCKGKPMEITRNFYYFNASSGKYELKAVVTKEEKIRGSISN